MTDYPFHTTLVCILLIGAIVSEGNAQQNSLLISGFEGETNNFYLRPEFSVTRSKLAPGTYLDSQFRLLHLGNDIRFQATIGFNQAEAFEIINPRLTVVLPGNVFISPSTLRAHPTVYSLSIPVGLSGWFQKGRFEMLSTVTVLDEETVVDTPELVTSGGNSLINWNEVSSSRTNFMVSGLLLYNLDSWHVGAGLSNVTLLRSGRVDSTFDFTTDLFPFLYLGYENDSFGFQTQSHYRDFLFTLQKPLGFLPAGSPGLPKLQLSYRIGIDRYEYSSLKAELRYPLFRDLTGFIRYHNLWGSRENFDNLEFRNWRESIIWNDNLKVGDHLPHSSIRAGINIPLLNTKISKISVESEEIIISRIYTAKLEYYSKNPVAHFKVRNTSSDTVPVSLTARSNDGSASYRSSVYRLEPNTITSIPIYFLYPFQPEKRLETTIRYGVAMNVNGNSVDISGFNLTLMGPNSWNGEVSDLVHFINKEETIVRSRAQSIYLEEAAEIPDTTRNRITQAFDELAAFLTAVGEGIHYVSDQVQSYRVDQVQYPLETLESAGGDCEDLVVYLASHLMSLGHSVSVVDLRPELTRAGTGDYASQNQLGHLFLLIDTNIPIEYSGMLGLNDFSFLSRKNRFGQYTIWIPYETTVLDRGFGEAWKTGTLQYYHNVIKNEGMKKGTIRLFNF